MDFKVVCWSVVKASPAIFARVGMSALVAGRSLICVMIPRNLVVEGSVGGKDYRGKKWNSSCERERKECRCRVRLALELKIVGFGASEETVEKKDVSQGRDDFVFVGSISAGFCMYILVSNKGHGLLKRCWGMRGEKMSPK